MTGSGTALDPYIITSTADLTAVNSDLGAYYELGASIDCGGGEYIIGSWQVTSPGYTTATIVSGGVTYYLHAFAGSFDGKGYALSNLTINESTIPDRYNVALFRGIAQGATLSNIKLVDASVTTTKEAATLVSCAFGNSTILGCSATGTVNGGSYSGGLIGEIDGATASLCSADVAVVSSGDIVGGFIGLVDDGIASNCFSKGAVQGTEYVGGFAGMIFSATTNCYSTGSVAGNTEVGGFAGGIFADDVVVNCFWDTTTSGTATGDGQGLYSNPLLFGKTTAEMKTQSTYTGVGWDFNTVWAISAELNDGYPNLLTFFSIITSAATNVTHSSANLWGTATGTFDSLYFKWGRDSTPTANTGAATAVTGSFSKYIDGLSPRVTYYFRGAGLVGSSEILGNVLNFTTGVKPVVSGTYGYMWIEDDMVRLKVA